MAVTFLKKDGLREAEYYATRYSFQLASGGAYESIGEALDTEVKVGPHGHGGKKPLAELLQPVDDPEEDNTVLTAPRKYGQYGQVKVLEAVPVTEEREALLNGVVTWGRRGQTQLRV